jgi:hypothetical protein
MDYACRYAARNGDRAEAILRSRATMAGDAFDKNARAEKKHGKNSLAMMVDWTEKNRLGDP